MDETPCFIPRRHFFAVDIRTRHDVILMRSWHSGNTWRRLGTVEKFEIEAVKAKSQVEKTSSTGSETSKADSETSGGFRDLQWIQRWRADSESSSGFREGLGLVLLTKLAHVD